MAKHSKDPWHNKTCKLIGVDKRLPLLLLTRKQASNQFKLVAGPKTNGRANYYTVRAKHGEIAECWRSCIFVPRGKQAPQVTESLGPNPTPKKLVAVAKALIRSVRRRPVTTKRLDCDAVVPVTRVKRTGETTSTRARSKKTFGSLRLYQVPRKLGTQGLLVFSFTVDGNPGGSGGAGSVHN